MYLGHASPLVFSKPGLTGLKQIEPGRLGFSPVFRDGQLQTNKRYNLRYTFFYMLLNSLSSIIMVLRFYWFIILYLRLCKLQYLYDYRL